MIANYALRGGALIIAGVMVYLLWFWPLYAVAAAGGAIGAGIYLALISSFTSGQKFKTSPENEWTGV